MARKKSSSYNNLKLIVTTFLLAVLLFAGLQWLNARRTKFVHSEAFGIDLPVAYQIHGIDVSRYQNKIAWRSVKQMIVNDVQLNFAFIKATEGVSIVDKQFHANWRGSKKNEITRGAYHFFTPGDDPEKQARFFISKVTLKTGDLPPVLDAELIGKVKQDVYRTKLRKWLEIVEAHYKVKPIIYTNAEFYKKYMGSAFDEYPLWVAHYYERKTPRINRPWTFWQHSDIGTVSGIKAKVDFNVFNGDVIAFQELLIP